MVSISKRLDGTQVLRSLNERGSLFLDVARLHVGSQLVVKGRRVRNELEERTAECGLAGGLARVVQRDNEIDRTRASPSLGKNISRKSRSEEESTYNNPTRKLSVDIDDDSKAEHVFEPCSEMQSAIATGAADREARTTDFKLVRAIFLLLRDGLRPIGLSVAGSC